MSAFRTARPALWLTAAALLVRGISFVGRGDYVAYDEAWYLILGRNLVEGRGYTLAGLPHVTLSPFYPIVAGAVDAVIGSSVLSGRLVAAVTGALLVLPCWFFFRRIAGERTALVACAFIAALPALAPFAAPQWVGWDLWVGAEPLFHLLMMTAFALAARAWEDYHAVAWFLCGAALALAYLTRAEGIVVAVLLGAACALAALLTRSPRRLVGVVLLGLAFAAVSAPYWMYLQGTLGRWTITGRGVQVAAPQTSRVQGERPSRSASVIERMLWQRDNSYAEKLYALHPSGTRMASDYWGVPKSRSAPPPAPSASPPADDLDTTPKPAPPPAAAADTLVTPATPPAAAPLPTRAELYLRALRMIFPVYLWPLALLGLLARARRVRAAEAIVTATVVAAAAGIAVAVAVDPRTQLMILPIACFYAAAGLVALEGIAHRVQARARIRPRVVANILVGGLLATMLLETARRTYLGATLATEVQLMGTEFRLVGQGLRRMLPPEQKVVSWHPAIALYARRDWHPLPLATAPDVIRYARAVGGDAVVFGGHNPSALRPRDLPREYLVLLLDDPALDADAPIRIEGLTPLFAVARLGSR